MRPLQCAAALIAAFVLLAPAADAEARDLLVGGSDGTFDTVSAALEKAADGDTVIIQSGVYAGGFELKKQVNIEAKPGATLEFGMADGIVVNGVKGAKLTGLTIVPAEGPPAPPKPRINVYKSSDIRISGCRIIAVQAVAISINSSTDVTVDGCRATGAILGAGISIAGNRILVTNSVVNGFETGVTVLFGKGIALAENFLDSNKIGVSIQRGKVDVVGNTISGPGNLGVVAQGSDVAIAGNTVRGMKTGIVALPPAKAVITGNTSAENEVGIGIGGTGFVVSRNTVTSNKSNGVLVVFASRAKPAGDTFEIRQNLISGNGGSGIRINNLKGGLVRQNLIEGNFRGITLAGGEAEISHNTIVLSKNLGVLLSGADKATLSRNIIANNGFGVKRGAEAELKSDANVVFGHMRKRGFSLYDTNYVNEIWLPVSGGEEMLVEVSPDLSMKAETDLNLDPGFVEIGKDYRISSASALAGRFKDGDLPGAFPLAGQ